MHIRKQRSLKLAATLCSLSAMLLCTHASANEILVLDTYYVNAAYLYSPILTIDIYLGYGPPSWDFATASNSVSGTGLGDPSAGSTGNGTNGKPCLKITLISTDSNPPRQHYRIDFSSGSTGGAFVQLITNTLTFADRSTVNISYTEILTVAPNITYSPTGTEFDDANDIWTDQNVGSYYNTNNGQTVPLVSSKKSIVAVFVPGVTSLPSGYDHADSNNPLNTQTYGSTVVDKDGNPVGSVPHNVSSGTLFGTKAGLDTTLYNSNAGQVVTRGADWAKSNGGTATHPQLTSAGNGC